MRRSTIAMLLAFCAAASVGCGTSSPPQEPGFVHFVKTKTGRALERDGKLYSTHPLWGDTAEAVAGDPVAEGHARKYVRQTWSSGLMAALALGLLLPAGFLMTSGPGHTGQRVAAVGLGTAGMTAFVLAMMMPVMARHHLYDAVNVYNDNLALGRPSVDASAGSESRKAGD
jgi:hypothetical protein